MKIYGLREYCFSFFFLLSQKRRSRNVLPSMISFRGISCWSFLLKHSGSISGVKPSQQASINCSFFECQSRASNLFTFSRCFEKKLVFNMSKSSVWLLWAFIKYLLCFKIGLNRKIYNAKNAKLIMAAEVIVNVVLFHCRNSTNISFRIQRIPDVNSMSTTVPEQGLLQY